MWTFVQQPGPVDWRLFLRGMWSRLSGRVTADDPWPRIEELDGFAEEAKREERAAAASGDPARASNEQERSASPASPASSAVTLVDDEAVLDERKLAAPAAPPMDLLTPPYTPPTLSPSDGTSPTRRPRSASPLSLPEPAFVAVDGILAESLDVDEKRTSAASSTTPAKKHSLPWPILEDEPTYRVDQSVNIFNYDCGLCVLAHL